MQKYDADFITRVALNDIETLAELILSDMQLLYENRKIDCYCYYDDYELSIHRKNVFESKYFKNYMKKQLKKELKKHVRKDKHTVYNKLINRSYNCVRDFCTQKKSMKENKSKYADFDLIMTAIDTSDEREISQMYVTVSALKNKLDEASYKKLRKFARERFGSCRIQARYFLYILSQIERFEKDIENKGVKEQQNVKIENQKETKEKKEQKKYNSKTKKKIDKSIEIPVSEADYKGYKKNEKLDKETCYKLYLYRRKYEDELKNTKLTKLTKSDLLFFLINTEKLVENQALTLEQILKIVKYADSNPSVRNPIGWLISRFMISRGRFYFLLSKSKREQTFKKEHPQSNSSAKSDRAEQEKQTNPNKNIYINADLAYFAKKYNISKDEILSYLSKFEHLSGDVSYIVERYLINKIYKNYLSQEEKLKLIKYAKQEIRKFVVLPETEEEFKEEIKSIIAAKIKHDYLTLSIQERLQLQMSGQYDTS